LIAQLIDYADWFANWIKFISTIIHIQLFEVGTHERHILIMDDKQERFRQILDRFNKLGWMPREDLVWLLETLAELLENGQ
jgi:hypothetical protein